MATMPQTLREPSMWDSFRQGVRASGVPWLFILPSLVIMLVISFLPQFYQIIISLQDFRTENLGGNPAPFIGLENFVKVLSGDLNVPNYDFFALLGFNVMWTITNVALHVTIGVGVALVLNSKVVIGRRLYRTLYVIPWALPPYISGLIWNNLWQQNGGGFNLMFGSINENLGTNIPTNTNWLGDVNPPIDLRAIAPALIIVGFGGLAAWMLYRLVRVGLRQPNGKFDTERVLFNGGIVLVAGTLAVMALLDVLNNGWNGASGPIIRLLDRAGAPVLAFYAVLIANSWLGWPFNMVVATGALQSIPLELYEAAEVDGATKWDQLKNITLPLIRPAMVPAIMLGTIWTFNQFNVIYFITAGGPRGQTDLLVTQSYKLIAQEQLYGAAAAFSIVVFFVLLVITLINNRVTRATEAFNE
ncbi:MAG: sugar ABC transporter permease [Burkholderiales bacterium]|nr:sugar ABC transporter permease [Anaerolineae bacterium]